MITDEISKMGNLLMDVQTHIAVADADLGGGRTIFRDTPLYYFQISIFWLIDLWRQSVLVLRGERAPK